VYHRREGGLGGFQRLIDAWSRINACQDGWVDKVSQRIEWHGIGPECMDSLF